MGDLNIFDLTDFIDKHNLSIFVETGTLHGDGIDHAKKYNFDKIYSIEIDDELYYRAVTKYENDDRVSILHGSSHEMIEQLISLDGNIFFWLDAHFPGADCGKRTYLDEQDIEKRMPLVTEVNLIKTRCKKFTDVILADDYWLYSDEYKDRIGDIESHMKSIGQNITKYELVGNTNSKFFYEAFSETHNLQVIPVHQGFMLITPKE